MLDTGQLQSICDFFAVGTRLHYEYLGVWGNHNYFVQTTAGTFVLKIMKETADQPRQLQTEITYLQYFSANGLKVPMYCKSVAGEYLYPYQDTYAVIRPKIAGDILSRANATPKILFQLGSLLGQTHSCPIDISLPSRTSWLNVTSIQQNRHRIITDTDFNKIDLVHDPVLDTDWSGYPTVLAHGDCWCPNIIVSPNQLVTLIDWQEASTGLAVLDIGRTLYGLIEAGLLNTEKYHAFIAGYQSVRKLTRQEEQSLAPAMKYTGLMVLMWRLLRFHNSTEPYDINQSAWYTLDLTNWQPPKS